MEATRIVPITKGNMVIDERSLVAKRWPICKAAELIDTNAIVTNP